MIRSLFKTIGWPMTTIAIALALFPLSLNALEILANPRTQIRDFMVKRLARSNACEVRIEGDSVFLFIPDSLATADDLTCHRAATVFHSICSLDPEITLYVYRLTPRVTWKGSGDKDSGENRIFDHWIPSARNPMNLEWTTHLVDLAGDPG
jgi:hypothetical protein